MLKEFGFVISKVVIKLCLSHREMDLPLCTDFSFGSIHTAGRLIHVQLLYFSRQTAET
jgi:hypothetical protein